MTKPLRTLFVVADGARARWIMRSDATRGFVTERTMRMPPGPPSPPPGGVVFDGGSGRRSGVGRPDARGRRRDFAREIADALAADQAEPPFERLAIVAPARMLSAICAALAPPLRAKVQKTLAKDLTKTPDHELGAWLQPLEMG